jgi:precorrin-3B C17-methyltransferase
VSGWLRVVGVGPGPERWLTPEVSDTLASATDLVGYHTYLARVPARVTARRHASDNGDELMRARQGLELAAGGARVVVVSGGDPGVFGMAAALCEALDQGPPALRALDVAVLPGVTAMLAAAARLGAPLGNDFCAINLSDNLKPWSVVETRLALAAQAGFVIALYNPASRARPEQVHRAFDILRQHRAPEAVVVFARAVGHAEESFTVGTLGSADPALADMRTLLIIGAPTTRCIARPDGTSWVYTPRRLDAEP